MKYFKIDFCIHMGTIVISFQLYFYLFQQKQYIKLQVVGVCVACGSVGG